MDLKVEIIIEKAEDGNTYNVELKGDDMGILIGKRGQIRMADRTFPESIASVNRK